MFTELMNNIWDEFARYIFNVEVSVEGEQQQQQQPAPRWGGGQNTSSTLNYAGGHSAQGREAIAAAAGTAVAEGGPAEEEQTISPLAPAVETRRLDENEKIGRNDPCWCGSGKKFKKCHGA
jgi:preprotein translocase subunit SecA